MNPLIHVARIATIVFFAALLPLTAHATVRREGSWPAADKLVSFEFEGKPSEGLRKLADEAGWSLVVSKGIELDLVYTPLPNLSIMAAYAYTDAYVSKNVITTDGNSPDENKEGIADMGDASTRLQALRPGDPHYLRHTTIFYRAV